jgi:hypothetical protein
MGTRRDHRIDRPTAERLLAGDPTVGGGVAQLLAIARAPAQGNDLAGEDEAVAMFRAAHLRSDRHLATRSAPGTALARSFTVKAAALLLAVVAGGVAVAASSGLLPGPLADPRPAHSHGTSHSTGRPALAPTPSRPAVPLPSHGSPTFAPQPLGGLCRAPLAQMTAGHSPPLDNPAFGALVSAAGGKDHVAAYCMALLASSSGGPGASGHPTPEPPHPTPGRSGHPTGEPTGHAGVAPAPRPSR